jgi:arylsulfatase A-like enzyme
MNSIGLRVAPSRGRPIALRIILSVLGCYPFGLAGHEGNTVLETPNMDRIGREGVTFNNAALEMMAARIATA